MKELDKLKPNWIYPDASPVFQCTNCKRVWQATLSELIKDETIRMGEIVTGYYFSCPACGEKYWHSPYKFKEK